ncbi:MAG: D-alanyl-D-alanine carboxypeptidase/D-alanyl-D-alanine-endopeptidase [Bacteriovoracaceae bacterium]|nr:D-alanyl-D-alanine carboxypeptidase/D-alanyl-D-alanine-endopeptidase [Bacteriovoracaceae bacterium]
MKLKSILWILCLSACTTSTNWLYQTHPASYSYILGDVHENKIELESNADVYMTPASCQKSVTALLALKLLGPDDQFETKLFLHKKKEALISFSGDPSLSSESLEKLLTPLANQTWNKIYIDESIFHHLPLSQNVVVDDLGSEYGAQASAINIDHNTFSYKISGGKIGELAIIEGEKFYSIDNQMMTTQDPSNYQIQWSSNLSPFPLKEDKLIAIGTINYLDASKEWKFSSKDSHSWQEKKIQSILKKLKIKTKAPIIFIRDPVSLPQNLKLVASVKSEKLVDLLSQEIKVSNNLFFDALFLKMIHTKNPQGFVKWTEANDIIKALIKEFFQVDVENSLFVDGSGLSRYNRIKPRHLHEILKRGYSVKEFVSSLPEPGEAKTSLEKRTQLPKGLRAKTGTMSGISCLSGYDIKDNSEKSAKVFVISATQFAPPLREIHQVMDKFIYQAVEL